MILALGSHLISSIGFEEEVTHTKRVRERQTENYCSLSRENFERGARGNQRDPKPGRTGRARISRHLYQQCGTNREAAIQHLMQ